MPISWSYSLLSDAIPGIGAAGVGIYPLILLESEGC